MLIKLDLFRMNFIGQVGRALVDNHIILEKTLLNQYLLIMIKLEEIPIKFLHIKYLILWI